MGLVTVENQVINGARAIRLDRDTDVSGDNEAVTVTPATGKIRKLRMVTAVYSTSVTKNVTITLNSGAGAGFDVVLFTIALSAAASGLWIPDGEVIISETDVLDVLAPAGGAGETVSVAVYSEVF